MPLLLLAQHLSVVLGYEDCFSPGHHSMIFLNFKSGGVEEAEYTDLALQCCFLPLKPLAAAFRTTSLLGHAASPFKLSVTVELACRRRRTEVRTRELSLCHQFASCLRPGGGGTSHPAKAPLGYLPHSLTAHMAAL